jgi:hypothetical protein
MIQPERGALLARLGEGTFEGLFNCGRVRLLSLCVYTEPANGCQESES